MQQEQEQRQQADSGQSMVEVTPITKLSDANIWALQGRCTFHVRLQAVRWAKAIIMIASKLRVACHASRIMFHVSCDSVSSTL